MYILIKFYSTYLRRITEPNTIKVTKANQTPRSRRPSQTYTYLRQHFVIFSSYTFFFSSIFFLIFHNFVPPLPHLFQSLLHPSQFLQSHAQNKRTKKKKKKTVIPNPKRSKLLFPFQFPNPPYH